MRKVNETQVKSLGDPRPLDALYPDLESKETAESLPVEAAT
jgi:hypothetical protein